MGWRSRRGFVAMCLALGLAVLLPATGQGQESPRAYGEQLVGRYRVDPELIARYSALAAGQGGHERVRGDSLMADGSPWIGPLQAAGAGRNPYTLVLTVDGHARSAGEVYAHWQAGWEVHESPQASREVLTPLGRGVRKGIAAGERVTMTSSSLPVSFRGERQVAPKLGLVQTRNFEITAVDVEIWSGSAPLALPSPSRGAMVALAGAGLLMVLPLGRRRRAEPAAEARPSRLPAAGVPAPVVETPTAPATPPAPDHRQRVRDNLLLVLTGGLAVPTEYDERRAPRRRRSKAPPAAH